MRSRIDSHRRRRNAGTPGEHRAGRARAGKRSAWRCFDPERGWVALLGDHFRMTARAAALDGKHVQKSREPQALYRNR